MAVFKEVKLNFKWDETMLRLGRDPSKWIKTHDQMQIMEDVSKEMEGLLHPGIAFKGYGVEGASQEGLRLTTGHLLESPVVTTLFSKAKEIVLMIYTIGSSVEGRVKEYSQRGMIAESFYLDMLGSLAVTELGRLAFEMVEKRGKDKNLKASFPLNPGTSHWPPSGQKIVLELSGGKEIGVTISESFLLLPTKTISMAIALGENVLTPEEGSSCHYCDNPDLCWGSRSRH